MAVAYSANVIITIFKSKRFALRQVQDLINASVNIIKKTATRKITKYTFLNLIGLNGFNSKIKSF